MKCFILLLSLAVSFAPAGLSSLNAAQPLIEALLKSGRWTNAPYNQIQDLTVQGNHVYVAQRLEGLKIIDVSDPSNPVRVGDYDTGDDALGVAVVGNYAYVANADAGLEVVGIWDPTHPVHVGGCLLPTFGLGPVGYAFSVTVSGNYAYIADTGAAAGQTLFGGLHVVDVSDPAHCAPVSKCATFAAPLGVQVSGNYAYAPTFEGLQVVDVGNPSNCVPVAAYTAGRSAHSVALSGNRAFLLSADSRLRILDVTNPTNVTTIHTYDNPESDTGDIALVGNYALMACGSLGVRVLDVSNPLDPELVGSFYTNHPDLYRVKAAAGKVYAGDYSEGLLVFPTIQDVQFTMRIHADPGVAFTVETATNLTHPIGWTQLVTTNLSTNTFDCADFDVKRSKNPHKYYRVRVPGP